MLTVERMMPPQFQTAVVQAGSPVSSNGILPLSISHSVPVPTLTSPDHVLVRVLAVALNPIDFKMVTYFPLLDSRARVIGCDFCGIVEMGSKAALAIAPPGTRVCGAQFPYGQAESNEDPAACGGSFAQWVVADVCTLLRVPESLNDLEGAAIGGICWGTCALALFIDADALALQGRPSKPTETKVPVVVYGGATATGTMACQLLKLSGYAPIAVTSEASAPLARAYGASATAAYTSRRCAEEVRSLAQQELPRPIRYALDCITTRDSVAICFAALGRAGGRYACLEKLEDEWRTRRAIHTCEVMGFEATGFTVVLQGDTTGRYSQVASRELYAARNAWAVEEMQLLLDQGLLKPHPVRQVIGEWQGIIHGLGMLQRGEVRGEKLVVRLAGQNLR